MKVLNPHSCRLASALLGFTLVLGGCGGDKKGGQAGAKKPEVKSLEVSPKGRLSLPLLRPQRLRMFSDLKYPPNSCGCL